MLRTRFTELVGCSVPIQQAPITMNPRLPAAVATAGGLGMVSVTLLSPDMIAALFDQLRRETTEVCGANFITAPETGLPVVQESIEAAAARAKVVEFFYGDPDRSLVDLVHGHGALAAWQVGSCAEAVAAAEAGCDFIVAQGIEAGGHVRGRIGLLALLSEVLDAVPVPVLAAGGIGTGRAMAAALAAGADGVRVGTRFVAAEEARMHPTYVNALIAATAEDTVYTEAFSGMWPNAPHRVLRSAVEAAQAAPSEILGEWVNEYIGARFPVHRFDAIAPLAGGATGAIEAMCLYAGESVDGVKKLQPATEIVQELAGEAEQLLRRWR
jgi:NAD(P)H-dependent flavin oxidoreductase YrpB (nitropropane dioxygenase family)